MGSKPDQVAGVYEGGFARDGEATDAYWARLYPDFGALDADGRLREWAPRIHGPLLRWCGGCVRMARSTLED